MKLDDLDNPTDVTDADRGERFTGQPRMAHRLAEAHGDRLMYVHGRGWFRWDGTRWEPDDGDVQATRAVIEVLYEADKAATLQQDKKLGKDAQACHSDRGMKGVLAIARTLPAFAHTVNDIDADPYLLNTATGTLDLRTAELRLHDPADRITKITRAGYRANAVDERWSTFLEQVLPDEPVRGFLQRVTGVALLGKVVEHVLPILTGTGANGKGTWYGAVLHALGDYAAPAEPELFMHREGAHPTGQMDLAGRRMVVVSESDKGRKLAEATMKRLTGGDKIKARHMNKDFVEFTPSHTAFLITNHLPKVAGDDPAIWRRLRVVPFDVVIPEADRNPHLEDELQLAADAVLAWAIAGYQQFVDQRGLAAPEAVQRATAAYQFDSDAVARFVQECCEEEGQEKIGDLYGAFGRWCATEGVDAGSKRAFGSELDRLGFKAGRDRNARFRYGIRLIPEGA